MPNRNKVIIGVIAVVVVGLSLAVLLPKFFGKGEDLSLMYDFTPVKRMDLSEKIDATGKVLALEKKDLYPDYEGSVEKVNVKAGDQVKKGDILISVTSAVLKQQWQEATSALKQAELNLKLATLQLATELGVNQISKQNAMQVENQSHQVALYREQVKQAKQRLDALNAKNDGYYVANNEKLLIRAPFDGQVAWINVNQGDKITPQSMLVTVIKPEVLGVEALVDENDIGWVKTGQTAVISGNDPRQSENRGVVTEISTLGQAVGEVVNFPIRTSLTGSPKGLLPGMSVDLTIIAAEYRQVLAIPAASVVTQNGRDLVSVRRENKIVAVPVEIGFRQGKFWEVKSGLKAGDQVAQKKPALVSKAPGMAVRPGMPVLRR